MGSSRTSHGTNRLNLERDVPATPYFSLNKWPIVRSTVVTFISSGQYKEFSWQVGMYGTPRGIVPNVGNGNRDGSKIIASRSVRSST
jgi:hypothetical protein